jgi:hypothetical protein
MSAQDESEAEYGSNGLANPLIVPNNLNILLNRRMSPGLSIK